MIRLISVLLMCHPCVLMADTWPKLVRVIGVSSESYLNIRQGPSIGDKIIGRFEPHQSTIEVVAESADSDWAQVNLGEQAGWVSLRYLKILAAQPTIPGQLHCRGTEPFWAASFDNQNLSFSSPEIDGVKIRTSEWLPSSNTPGRYSTTSHSASESQSTAVLSRAQCSDGMSDRAYGFSLDLIFKADGSNTHLTGCCSLTK